MNSPVSSIEICSNLFGETQSQTLEYQCILLKKIAEGFYAEVPDYRVTTQLSPNEMWQLLEVTFSASMGSLQNSIFKYQKSKSGYYSQLSVLFHENDSITMGMHRQKDKIETTTLLFSEKKYIDQAQEKLLKAIVEKTTPTNKCWIYFKLNLSPQHIETLHSRHTNLQWLSHETINSIIYLRDLIVSNRLVEWSNLVPKSHLQKITLEKKFVYLQGLIDSPHFHPEMASSHQIEHLEFIKYTIAGMVERPMAFSKNNPNWSFDDYALKVKYRIDRRRHRVFVKLLNLITQETA